jgi:hypothetical protein
MFLEYESLISGNPNFSELDHGKDDDFPVDVVDYKCTTLNHNLYIIGGGQYPLSTGDTYVFYTKSLEFE